MKDLIKRYWDIFGSVITSLALSILADWQLESVNLISSEIVLFLVCLGVFTCIKKRVDERNTRKLLVVDKLASNQRAMRAVTIANNPTKTGEELGEVLIDTMKGGRKIMQKLKNVFVWIKNYWQQLLGIISVIGEYALYVYALIDDKLGFILKYLPQENVWQIVGKVAIGVLVSLIVLLQIRNMCKWVGVGNIEQAKEYIANKAEETKAKLSPSAKENIKKVVKEYQGNLKDLNKKINSMKSELSSVEKSISSAKELIQLGLGDQAKYGELVSKKDKIKNELTMCENQEKEIKANIEKYKQVL